MTVAVASMGLVPIMWSTGTGADVMKRIAAPMIGGLFTSFLMELMVYPAIYYLWKWHTEVKPQAPPSTPTPIDQERVEFTEEEWRDLGIAHGGINGS